MADPFQETPYCRERLWAITANHIDVAGPSSSRRPWRKNLVDQSIIRWFECVDESDALQDEPILQTPARCGSCDGW
jgi:hypothetical protein